MYKKATTEDGKEYYLVLVEEMETATAPEPKHTGLANVDGVGDEYYYIAFNGEAKKLKNQNDEVDRAILEIGNAYTDRQLAIDTARANRIRNALRDYAAEHNKVVLDWEDIGQIKYHLNYDFDDRKLNILQGRFIKYDTIYFDTFSTAEAAIEAVGRDDVTWLLRDFQPWIGAY